MRERSAIVVLGCRVERTGEPSAALERRLRWGAAAYRAGLAPRIVAAGGRLWNGVSEADAMRARLAALGVPDEAVVRELCSLTTLENALFCGRLFEREGLRRAHVLTCAWHLPRALACFRAAGVEAIGIAASAPPASIGARVSRALHEQVSRILDRQQLARIRSAARAGLGPFEARRGREPA